MFDNFKSETGSSIANYFSRVENSALYVIQIESYMREMYHIDNGYF